MWVGVEGVRVFKILQDISAMFFTEKSRQLKSTWTEEKWDNVVAITLNHQQVSPLQINKNKINKSIDRTKT